MRHEKRRKNLGKKESVMVKIPSEKQGKKKKHKGGQHRLLERGRAGCVATSMILASPSERESNASVKSLRLDERSELWGADRNTAKTKEVFA